MNLEQVSIRGSNGYRASAPEFFLPSMEYQCIQGDTGDIVWELIPIADIEQIEIIKGPQVHYTVPPQSAE